MMNNNAGIPPMMQPPKEVPNQDEQPQSFEDKIVDVLRACRGSRKLVVVIVAVALLLDNMLLTSVVPIIPDFLFELHHTENEKILNETLRTSTPSPLQEYRDRMSLLEKPKLLPEYSRGTLPVFKSSTNGDATSSGLNLQCTCRQDANGEFVTEITSAASINDQQDQELNREGVPPGSWSARKGRWTTTTTEEPEPTPPGSTISPLQKQRHEDLQKENLEVGVMFASKPIIQAITNPFVGTLTNKIGYSIPMFGGFVIMFIATLVFAVGESFSTLLVARMLQGVGSACTSVAGMGMLADRYPDDRERGNAMAIALGGLALGVLIGPPFGGVLFQFIGKSVPFIILAILALFDGLLQLLVLQPKISKEEQEGASLMTLIRDPYILVAAGAITFANAGIAILEPSLPLWMMDTMNASNWEQGAAFLPASISYLIGTNIFGPLGHKMGRWLASMLGIIIIGLSLLTIPLASSLDDLIIPNGCIGFAIGMVDSSMMPTLGYLVDIRHTSVYGSVYAIGDVAFCAGFVIGPVLSGTIGRFLGFEGLIIVTAIICFLFAPCLLMLRNPPILNAEQILLQNSGVKYVNYTDSEDPAPDQETKYVNRVLQHQPSLPLNSTPHPPTHLNPFLDPTEPSGAPAYVH